MHKSPTADLSKEYLTVFLGSHLVQALHKSRKGFCFILLFWELQNLCPFILPLCLWFEGGGCWFLVCFVWSFPCFGHCSSYKMKSGFSSVPHSIKRQSQSGCDSLNMSRTFCHIPAFLLFHACKTTIFARLQQYDFYYF